MLDWIKKYLVFTIALAAACIILLAIGGRLFFVVQGFQKEKRELESAKASLDQLYHRPVFPSTANIAREKVKMADLIDEYNELDVSLGEGQVLPQPMEAAHFWGLLEDVLPRIRERFRASRVIFSKESSFGFEKYAGGKMPDPKDIPRLVQQLKITEILCAVLAEAGVKELVEFSRDEFESAPAAAEAKTPAGRQRQPAPAGGAEASQVGDALYSTQHFKLTFRAPERLTLDLFNRLARLPMFTVITWVAIHNPRLETAFGGAQAGADDKTKAAATNNLTELSRDKRVVFGKEEVEVKLEMDVYNFKPPIDFREGQGAKKAAK